MHAPYGPNRYHFITPKTTKPPPPLQKIQHSTALDLKMLLTHIVDCLHSLEGFGELPSAAYRLNLIPRTTHARHLISACIVDLIEWEKQNALQEKTNAQPKKKSP